MSQLALYRAWRPQTFDEMVAQKQVVFPLKQAVISGDLGHAYLFAGTRGTGKTSMAKIFAKAVNCLHPQDGNPCNSCAICQGINSGALLDVMEIDAASHNSVDNIRRLTDEVRFMPSEARYKVYIIDEVHMLSQGAFNALLKTLEEPPAHVIFILATTEVQRIPATILSRCQRFEFRRIPVEDIFHRLQAIAQADQIQVSEEALQLMARLGDGALRDAISLLDQAQAGIKGEITETDVLNLAGLVQDDFLADFCQQVLSADLPACLASLDELQMSGRDLQRFLQDFLRYLRDILVVSLGGETHKLLTVSPAGLRRLQDQARLTTSEEVMAMLGRLAQVNSDLRWSTDPRTSLELAFIGEIARRQVKPAPASVPVPKPDLNKSSKLSEPRAVSRVPEPPPAQMPARPKTVEASVPAAPVPVPAPLASKPEPVAPEPVVPEEALPKSSDLSETMPAPLKPEPPAPQLAESNPNLDPDPDPDPKIAWNLVLDGLRARDRYDIILLLRPAQVSWKGDQLVIHYAQEHKAHAAALQRPENQEALLDAIYELIHTQGLSRPRLQIELAGEAFTGENLNPDEPVWVQKLRKAGEHFQQPFDPADVKPAAARDPQTDWSPQTYYNFPDGEDKLPY
ncbi:MAG: DNA polymerase III subunit gamma/tau [Eubacteriales bacterium]|nr:DNA polymerase III subunit gamma/tau [Clostridiales bacterium]MDY5836527.1 DNA polymerase III subunit gamma/tau [Eubacteriales bacterium]